MVGQRKQGKLATFLTDEIRNSCYLISATCQLKKPKAVWSGRKACAGSFQGETYCVTVSLCETAAS